MREIYLIQDVESKHYYYSWHTSVGFSNGIYSATHFISEAEAVKALNDEYNTDLFNDVVLEIKKYYINLNL